MAGSGDSRRLSETELKIYIDRVSQPCRSVLLLCKAAGIPFEEVRINVMKGEQRTPTYLAINPLGKVPAMQDGEFCLGESAAIMRFLCDSRQLADHWYPRDLQARARVSSAMDWHGATLRTGSMLVVWHRTISINMGVPGNERLVTDYGLPTLKAALKTIDSVWLREGRFVAGQAQPSIADLLLACEVEQLCMLDGAMQGPTMAELLAPHPRVSAWLQRMREACAPHYDEVHGVLRRARDRMVARKQAQQGQQGSKL